jgi:hypothetical protein
MYTDAEPVKRKANRDAQPHAKEKTMDAKYNWLIDNVSIRVTLNTVAFALWMAAAVALLELAAKL